MANPCICEARVTYTYAESSARTFAICGKYTRSPSVDSGSGVAGVAIVGPQLWNLFTSGAASTLQLVRQALRQRELRQSARGTVI
jgi:hypothetical protein